MFGPSIPFIGAGFRNGGGEGPGNTGWKIAGSAVSVDTGDKPFVNPLNVTLEDASLSASLDNVSRGDTDSIKATQFALHIPGAAIVTGIEFRYDVKANNSTDMDRNLMDLVVANAKIDRYTNLTAPSGVGLTSELATYTWGDFTDMWVLGSDPFPTVAQMNAPGFGFQFDFQDGGSSGIDSVWVRAVFARVYFTI